ncbi:hypothetical protein TTY48_03890 [Tsukamurella sp. TY48]|nr:hypothetical protein TTY48_03890 [Tsukamurella sp. TY48]
MLPGCRPIFWAYDPFVDTGGGLLQADDGGRMPRVLDYVDTELTVSLPYSRPAPPILRKWYGEIGYRFSTVE